MGTMSGKVQKIHICQVMQILITSRKTRAEERKSLEFTVIVPNQKRQEFCQMEPEPCRAL